VGTVLYATVRNLPPFLVLACLAGLVNGDVGPGPFGPDAATEVNAACAAVTLRPLRDLSGPFSDPPRHVDPLTLELKITVDRPHHVVVEALLPQDRQNRLVASLLAALLIVVLAFALAVLARRRRSP
jgi:hypothetical protein